MRGKVSIKAIVQFVSILFLNRSRTRSIHMQINSIPLTAHAFGALSQFRLVNIELGVFVKPFWRKTAVG